MSLVQFSPVLFTFTFTFTCIESVKSLRYHINCSQLQLQLQFSQSKLQCKNTCKNCKLAREPGRNQIAYEAWAPQSQRNKL